MLSAQKFDKRTHRTTPGKRSNSGRKNSIPRYQNGDYKLHEGILIRYRGDKVNLLLIVCTNI
jgi:hypothetical protein